MLRSHGYECRSHRDFTKLQAEPATRPLWPLVTLNQQVNEGVTVMAGEIEPDSQEKTWLVLHKMGKQGYVWLMGDALGHLLVRACPVTEVWKTT